MMIIQFQLTNTTEDEQKLVPDFCEWLDNIIYSDIDTKTIIIADFLYTSILDSCRKYPKDIEKILKKYQKIVPYVFDLGGRAELHSENFDAKRTAKIIVEILYLKKDELDKVDGGLSVI